VERDEEAVDVEDRQRVDQHVAAGGVAARRPVPPAPEAVQHLGVREQVPVRELRALAAAGGAARVDDGREIVRGARPGGEIVVHLRGALEQAARAVVPEREHHGACRPRTRGG
jgi:hypothetical protein